MNDTNPSQPQTGPESKPSSGETKPPLLESKPSEFWTVFLLGLLLGVLGAHRFYARKFKTAIVQLLTCGGFGIWSFIDTIIILLGKFTNANGVAYRNPKPKVTWGVFAVVVILGFASAASDKGNSGSGGSRFHSSYPSGSSHKSARQLITDYAKEQYGNDADVEIDGPMYGGTYQVTVRTRVVSGQYAGGINDYNYTATVDESAQEVTTWEMTGHN